MDGSNRKRTVDVALEHIENNTANTKHIKCENMPASTNSIVLDATGECSDDTASDSSTVILSSDDECSDQKDEYGEDREHDGCEDEIEGYEDYPFVYPDSGNRGFESFEAENPSEVKQKKWLKHPVCDSPVVTGKWKMFFPGHVIDQRWKEAKELFQSGKLPTSISRLLVSTRFGSSGEGPSSHCMLFCCAPENREATINIGTNLMLVFAPADEVIWFKDDNAAEGQPQLFLPFENCRVSPLSPFGKESPKKIYSVPPSQNDTDKWMTLNLENTYAGGGKWIFRFSQEDTDRKWMEVKALAEKKELVGVKEVVISTKLSKTDGGLGYVMLFVCGPANDEERVMVVGRNLLQIFPPCSSQEILKYTSTEQSIWKSQPGDRGINHLYELPCKKDPTD